MNEHREMLRNALGAIENLQLKLRQVQSEATQPIAVIGCGMRYPGGVETLDDLRVLLENRVNAVRRVPEDRWDADAYYSPDANALGKIVTRNGGFLDQIDQFDPAAFGISPREAKSLDPQHRLLLETAHEAMESAAIAPDSLTGSRTGVFVGISTNEYARLMYSAGVRDSDVYSATGGALNAAPGRISFTYGFNGPCVAVDTACSSSLNAIHLACQSLRRGESDLALAGGVAVIAMPDAMVLFSRWGMLSPDGACKTFDASANGFARGEGCGMIALKRLADAQADGNPILGVIGGTATNSDGRSSGMTVPNGPAQEKMLNSALADAGLEPQDIDYVEAHGTGTPIGDPIEVGALGAVLCEGRAPGQPLRIGSLKTNIGHAEAAAGVGGLLKVIASLQSEKILPQLHFNEPNPGIDWDGLPIRVVSEAEPWPRRDTPRRAGVSAFGFSGTNVHVILEDAPAPAEMPRAEAPDAPIPVVLSAGTEAGLRDLAARHADFLSGPRAPLPVDLARTLAEGRSQLPRRAAFAAQPTEEMSAGLRAIADGAPLPGTATGMARPGAAPRVAFLCTGQGSQYAGMAQGLYEAEPVFRTSIDRSTEILANVLPQPLTKVLFPADPDASPISETAYTQPALFAVEYAMAELWQSWGVMPSVVLGHSIGEYVAACLAGVMGHEQALRLVAERGRLMQKLPSGGAMAAVFAPEAQVIEAIAGREDEIAVAGINAPDETVVSGSAEAVEAVLRQFEADGVSANRLTVSHAFHSPLLDPMLAPFETFARGFDYQTPHIPLISNLTGTAFGGGQAPDAKYWRDHARGAVRFADCVAALETAGADILIEIGPHPALLGLAARARPEAVWRSVPTLRRGQDAAVTATRALTEAFASGVDVNWNGVFKGRGGRLITAPTYPFQRERYWFDAPAQGPAQQADLFHPLLGAVQQTPPPNRAFLNTLSADNPAYLADHAILEHVIFPATGYVEMALAAAAATKGEAPVVIEGLTIDAPLALPQGETRSVHTEMTREKDGVFTLNIRELPSGSKAEWRSLAHLSLNWERLRDVDDVPSAAEAQQKCETPVDIAEHYAELAELGVQYGPVFHGLSSISKGEGIAVATVDLSEAISDVEEYRLHPALLDSAFHAVSAVVANRGEKRLYLPVSIDEIHWWRKAPARVRVVAQLRSEDENQIVADLRLETEDGDSVARVCGLHARVASASALEKMLGIEKAALQTLTLNWEDVPRSAAEPVAGLLVLGAGGPVSADIAEALGARLATAAGLPEAIAEGVPDWVIDCTHADDASDARSVFGTLLTTVQTLEAKAPSTGLCLVTNGARRVRAEEAPDPDTGVTVGLCHVIDMERLTAPLVQLDLDPFAPCDPQAILDALAQAGTEPELALRAGGFVAPRLRPLPRPETGSDNSRRVLRITERGDLDRLRIEEEPRTSPGKDEVEIAVRAAGLNFRDVLNALGMYPGDAGRLGSECAGVITRIGEGVEGLRPGDPVVALAGDSFSSHVTVKDRFVLSKPDTINFADAVTIPNTYLTAALCYATAGGLQSGQRVLVHAAAGGVGLAALRLAVRAGAEVIATAGSEAKRAFVLRQGAKHAFDSRSASFGDRVTEVTGGEGVDIVINALSGEMIEAGMRVTRPGGAFLEIGKNNIWTAEEATERAPHVRYAIVDLGEKILSDPAWVRQSFQNILSDIEAGLLAPLPVQAFPLADAREAFRFMANARHTGKVALIPEPVAGMGMTARSDSSYLVTGGLAGIGLAAAERLAARGAGEVILVGRSGDSPEAQAAATELATATGVKVRSVACDVTDTSAVAEMISDLAASALPLRGIIHAAGVLDDAPLPEQSIERFDRVAGPKISGARNLLGATRRLPLDFVVLYSSSSAVLGSPGQANYAAANAWLDSVALRERAEGRPVTSIAWGAWGEVGMAARLSDTVRERWKQVGLGQLGTEEALDKLEEAVGREVPFAMIARLDLAQIASKGSSRIRALLDQHPVGADPMPGQGMEQDGQHILDAGPDERPALLLDFVTAHVARVLGYNASAIDADRPFSDLGFDSLMAVQLRNSIRAALGMELSLRDLLGGATASETAAQLNKLMDSRDDDDGDPNEQVWEETVI
jgi:acyl transferase domain-containing protein/NADPH:quinone reductase-like Zn-dependent oxidoreductase/NADP-dependent 3-hydroxy acid dehydrogenase YdfG/acyl carrier protein